MNDAVINYNENMKCLPSAHMRCLLLEGKEQRLKSRRFKDSSRCLARFCGSRSFWLLNIRVADNRQVFKKTFPWGQA